MKAAPSAAFVMAKSDFLFQFEIVAFDPPTYLGQIDHALERDVGGQCGEPVVVRLCLRFRPLDQQPLFGRGFVPLGVIVRRADAPSCKSRGQWRVAAVPPGDRLPAIGGEFEGQGLGRDRPMCFVAA